MRRLILFTLRVGEVIALKTAHVCGSLFAKYIIITTIHGQISLFRPASTANPLGAAPPTHIFWRALRSSTRRAGLQRR